MKDRLLLALECAIVGGLACLVMGPAAAQMPGDCGNPFENNFGSVGPFDYRTATAGAKRLVEMFHFTTNVETLQSGNSGPLGGELDYTLRVFPNHARALMSMIRLGQRDKTIKPQGAHYTVECYVERAVEFKPDDTAIRQLRGIYYSMHRNYDKAIADFQLVIEQQPDNANAHYNLGLAYFEIGNYEGAVAEAKRANALGFPLAGLRNKLKAKAKWKD
jgi:hypothetical protein